MLHEYFFASRDEASTATAKWLSDALQATLAEQSQAAMVLSGGSSPVAALQALSTMPLEWKRVTVTLSDERWVAANHDDSNERMLRHTLLTNAAKDATVMPLFRSGVDIAAAPRQLQQDFAKLPLPFAATLLGMGEDGHYASLFPDFAGLADALDESGQTRFIPVMTAASPHPRISMTLSALLQSREIILLFFGTGKRAVYESVRAGRSKLPIASLLAQTRVPLRVIWAP